MTGLLIDGRLVPVPGVEVVPPTVAGGPMWAQLDPGDYKARPTPWIRQILLHTTKGQWPQYVRAGSGPGGQDRVVADFWRGDPVHSAAHLVVDTDGSVVCLCDLARVMTYHATASNPWSVGIEMYQMSDGGVYEATLASTVALARVLCTELGIPEQMPRGPYQNRPLRRMDPSGGPDCVGVFGHRDNTDRRGRGDPGDEIGARLAAIGFERFDYDTGEDLRVGRERQVTLNALDAAAGHTYSPLVVDGVCGPASLRAMRRHGFSRWADVS